MSGSHVEAGAEVTSPPAQVTSASAAFFDRFVAPMESRMIRSIWRITRNSQDAEDAMQNALIAIWRQRELIASHSTPQALLLRICLDAACDVVRRRSRERRGRLSTEASRDLPDSTRTPLDAIADRELVEKIVLELHRLPRQQAVCMAMKVFEGLPYEEIASALSCSAATVRKHVERARAKLKVVLANHDLGQPQRR